MTDQELDIHQTELQQADYLDEVRLTVLRFRLLDARTLITTAFFRVPTACWTLEE